MARRIVSVILIVTVLIFCDGDEHTSAHHHLIHHMLIGCRRYDLEDMTETSDEEESEE